MQDIQSSPAQLAMPIDRVGITDLTVPIMVRDRAGGYQNTVAKTELSVDLPSSYKGTHMSRFVESMESWSSKMVDYAAFKELLIDVISRFEATRAHLSLSFPYFMRRLAPATQSPGIMNYLGHLAGELIKGKEADGGKSSFRLTMGVDVPVMTVCPCSLMISEQGAHSQRAQVRIRCRSRGFVWLEELIEMAEAAGSSPVYSLLKREDEKSVTEKAFSDPVFVEDVARRVAASCNEHLHIIWYKVEVESQESIHNHNAFACIESKK